MMGPLSFIFLCYLQRILCIKLEITPSDLVDSLSWILYFVIVTRVYSGNSRVIEFVRIIV